MLEALTPVSKPLGLWIILLNFQGLRACSQCFHLVLTPLAGVGTQSKGCTVRSSPQHFTPLSYASIPRQTEIGLNR